MTNFSASPSLETTNDTDIILSTLNARYAHTSMGLHYLYANMGALQAQTQLMEFVIGTSPTQLAEKLIARNPKIVAFGVYIWNVTETTQLVTILKCLKPSLKIILGGPEVSYESAEQTIVQLADFVITGWGEVTFPQICQQILTGP
ncbi:MAG: cobalamin B12-binding domain-containing protein, partial [Neisseriaceae bacterium]|nr:cobalamin B12-binding domain-containing protein [Neisseriaceae bacterium]